MLLDEARYDNASDGMPFRNGTLCDWYKIILF